MNAVVLRGDAAHLPLPDESVDLFDEFVADSGHPSAADRKMVARLTGGGIRSREVQPEFSDDMEAV